MGGLQSLVGFIAIKIKVVLVAITIIGVVALACKVFGFFKYTGYLYKNDYPVASPPHEYYGYHGPPHDHHSHGNDWSSYSEHYGRSTNRRPETATPSQLTKRCCIHLCNNVFNKLHYFCSARSSFTQ